MNIAYYKPSYSAQIVEMFLDLILISNTWRYPPTLLHLQHDTPIESVSALNPCFLLPNSTIGGLRFYSVPFFAVLLVKTGLHGTLENALL